MRKLAQFGLCAALALGVAQPAGAQSRGVRVAPVRVSTPAVVRTATVPRFVTNSRPTVTFNGVPGLGFDYVHLAAVTRGLRPGIQRVHPISALTPLVPFAFPLAAAPIIIIQQPPVIVMQPAEAPEEEEAALAPAAAPRARAAIVQPAPAPPVPQVVPEPLPSPTQDTGEFVLVKRDGSLLFAVAFSADANQLTYVTREGVRRSMLLSQLDPDATRHINAERGTSIQLPL